MTGSSKRRKRKEPGINRAHELQHLANAGKVEQLDALLQMWRSSMVAIQYLQIARLRRGENIGWLTAAETKALKLPLSSRQTKSATNQVNTALASWSELAVKQFRKIVAESTLPDDEKHRLHRINLSKGWWSDHAATVIIGEVLRTVKFPNVSRTHAMVMDTAVCRRETTVGAAHDQWLRIAGVTGDRPVYIPVYETDYFQSRPGTEQGVTQVVVRGGQLRIYRVKKTAPVEPLPVTEATTIALDWGVVNMFTTDDGRKLGTRIYAWLLERDRELLELTRALQRNGIRPGDSRRYRALQNRIRAYIRNEVNRIINGLCDEGVSEFIVEHLDFRSPDLGKALNRILSRAGRAAVRAKLKDVTETRGVTVTEVNPAYTSQECSGCEFVYSGNRSDQKVFSCRFCGKKCHADVNAARVTRRRRSLPGPGLRHCGKHQVLTTVDDRFTQRWGISATDIRQRQSRGRSTATPASSAA